MKIKYLPNDFLVEEIIEINNLLTLQSNILLLKITKKNISTLKLIDILNKEFGTKVSFLGMKDKYSISTQYVTIQIQKVEKIIDKIKKINNSNLSLELIGFAKENLKSVHLIANKFNITLRDIDEKEIELYIKNIQKLSTISCFFNYYDTQRIRLKKHIFPVALTKEEIKKNIEKFLFSEKTKIKDYITDNKEEYSTNFRFIKKREEEIAKSLIFNLNLSRVVLEKTNNIPVKVYQKENFLVIPSLEALSLDDLKKIFLDFSTPEDNKRDFSKSLFTQKRNPIAFFNNMSFQFSEDEHHKGRLKIELNFTLPKGSFATILIKHIIPYPHYSKLKYKPYIID